MTVGDIEHLLFSNIVYAHSLVVRDNDSLRKAIKVVTDDDIKSVLDLIERRIKLNNNVTKLSQVTAFYIHDIAKSHFFSAGNDQTALLSANIFLALNGCEIRANPTEQVELSKQAIALIDGDIGFNQFALFIDDLIAPLIFDDLFDSTKSMQI